LKPVAKRCAFAATEPGEEHVDDDVIDNVHQEGDGPQLTGFATMHFPKLHDLRATVSSKNALGARSRPSY
jgi:hypothetical protein